MILVDNYEAMTARPEIGCNLECVKDDLATELVHEYCGPVKIVVVETPKQEYLFKSWGAAFLAFANMLIGGFCFIILVREAAHGKDNPNSVSSMHMVLSTLGLLFLSSFGMMNMMPIYGPSTPMKKKDRRSEHFLFHTFGLLLACAGGVFYMSGMEDLKFKSVHTGTCVSGLVLGLIAEVTGCIISRILKPWAVTTMIHIMIAFPAYVCYVTCFLSALQYDYLRKFCLNMAKQSGRPTFLTIGLSLIVIIGIGCLVSCLILFRRKRKPTCITFDEEKKRAKARRLKEEKLAKIRAAKLKKKEEKEMRGY